MASEFTVGDWTVRADINRIARDEVEVRLEPRVMDVLVYLAERPGEVLSTDQIIRDVWPEPFVSDGALLTAISSLRRALGDDPRKPTVVETIPKRGYRLIADSSARHAALAVLPLANLSGDSDEDYFADGMTDALIAELGRLPGLRVISRQSIMAYRGSEKSLPQIGRELRAGTIVEGSVMRAANRVRISAQLIDAVDDRHLWAESYERQTGEALHLQREVARAIAAEVSRRLLSAEEPTPRQTVHSDALVAYLRGRFHYWKFSPEHATRALEYFEEAVEIDPSLAQAHAAIGDAWGQICYWGGTLPQTEARDKCYSNAARAVQIDSQSPDAHLVLGAALFHSDRDWTGAETEFRRALELNPSYAQARQVYALFLFTMDRPEEAMSQVEQAIRLDPLNPAGLLIHAWRLGTTKRFDEAREVVKSLLELAPDHPPAHQLLADLEWNDAGGGTALELERRVWQHDPEISSVLNDATVSATAALRNAAELLSRRRERSYVQPNRIARLYCHAGDHESALDWLQGAVDANDLVQFDHLRLSPEWNALRGHPSFTELERQLGLPL